MLAPFPSRLENNKSRTEVCLFASFPTLRLALGDSAGLESCSKQCLFPALFPVASLVPEHFRLGEGGGDVSADGRC